jgi:hypothetical protein
MFYFFIALRLAAVIMHAMTCKAWFSHYKIDARQTEQESYLANGLAGPCGIILKNTLGLVGESGELLQACTGGECDRIQSELGDVLWYATRLYSDLGYEELYLFEGRFRTRHNTLLSRARAVVNASCAIAEGVKKHVFHCKDFNLLEIMENLFFNLDKIAGLKGTDLETVARLNIEKLKRRYPGKYSHEACAAKADEA